MNWREFRRLLGKLFLLAFEILKAICDIRSLYLLVAKVFELFSRLAYVVFTEVDETEVLLEIFLLAIYATFFYFKRVAVFEFGFGLLELNLFENFVEVCRKARAGK